MTDPRPGQDAGRPDPSGSGPGTPGAAASGPRVVVRPTDAAGRALADAVAVTVGFGDALELGREADLDVGVDPKDAGISRVALRVEPTALGWRLRIANRNGAIVHPWAQPPAWLTGGSAYDIAWPRVAVRLTGADPDAVLHWVLLECDDYADVARSIPDVSSTATVHADRPEALTTSQRDALDVLFAEHREWPPRLGPTPDSLKRVARRLGVSQAAVYQRLQGAQQKAYQLGSHPQLGVTEPDYFYALTRHGYLGWPSEHCPAVERA